VQKNASTCIREVAKHTPELAKLIVNAGGASALVEYISEAKGHSRLPGIMALGFVAAFSETLALAVVVSKGVTPLKDALITEPEDHIKAASAWALGQVGRHSPDHARALAENEVLRVLLANYMHEANSADLRTKSKRALKAILKKCTHLPALEPLLKEAPIEIQKYILEQFAKTLPHDQQARRTFVQSGGLPLVCQLAEDADGKLAEHIKGIQDCYPPEIVEYYSYVVVAYCSCLSLCFLLRLPFLLTRALLALCFLFSPPGPQHHRPNYANQLMKKIDEFQPSGN
jgi:hypothetical protein